MSDFTRLLSSLIKARFWTVLLILGALFLLAGQVDYESGILIRPNHARPLLLGTGITAMAIAITMVAVQTFGSAVTTRAVKAIDRGFALQVAEQTTIEVICGRLQEVPAVTGGAFVLSTTDFFDSTCLNDQSAAAGACINAWFPHKPELVSTVLAAIADRVESKAWEPKEIEKTSGKKAASYGTGRALILTDLEDTTRAKRPVILVSTATQRPNEGIRATTQTIAAAVEAVLLESAHARVKTLYFPVLGAGHGVIPRATALMSMVLALSLGLKTTGRHLTKVTIVVFQANRDAKPEISSSVIRRCLVWADLLNRPSTATAPQPQQGEVTT